jgi:hypothetical protein
MKPGREIVENENVLPGVKEFKDHMAADIAGATCDQYAHQALSTPLQFSACYRKHVEGLLTGAYHSFLRIHITRLTRT